MPSASSYDGPVFDVHVHLQLFNEMQMAGQEHRPKRSTP